MAKVTRFLICDNAGELLECGDLFRAQQLADSRDEQVWLHLPGRQECLVVVPSNEDH